MSIAATLSPMDAARRPWSVVVIGAGPAGAMTSYLLAANGIDVLLVDRAEFPRSKVCGCCINGSAIEQLSAVGLSNLLVDAGAVPLENVHLFAGSRSLRLALPTGVVLSRSRFDAALIAAAIAAGTHFLPRVQARLMPSTTRGTRTVHLGDGDAEARIVVVADGLGGGTLGGERGGRVKVEELSRIGAGVIVDDAPAWFGPRTIYMACGTSGYVGAARLEDGRLDMAAALDPALVRRNGSLAGAVAVVTNEVGWPAIPSLKHLPWRGTPGLTRGIRPPAGERFFVVGDAAGYVEPFTGEGIAWALLSAAALVPLIGRAVEEWRPAFVGAWQRRLEVVLGHRRRVCRLLAQCLRRPAVTGMLIGLLNLAPILARPLIAGLNRPPPPFHSPRTMGTAS